MNKDEYGEIINGEDTYKEIAYQLKNGNSIIIGWTDQEFTHYDILFSLNVVKDGALQSGLRWNDINEKQQVDIFGDISYRILYK